MLLLKVITITLNVMELSLFHYMYFDWIGHVIVGLLFIRVLFC